MLPDLSWLGLGGGALIGFALGLTGSGGSVLAVPLLIYGIGTPPREAVGVSLAAVGSTALFGVFERWRRGELDFRTGVLFAVCGMAGTPIGALVSRRLPADALILLFAALMLAVAWRMWSRAQRPAAGSSKTETTARPRSRAALAGAGLATGTLSGLLGVGGGLLIIPSLVIFGRLDIRHAASTSLFVIAVVSAAGLASHIAAGSPVDASLATTFSVGGVAGVLLGARLSRRASGPTLERVFAAAVVLIAAFMIGRTLFA